MKSTESNNDFDINDICFNGKVNTHDLRIECRTDDSDHTDGDKNTRRWIDMVTITKQ